jgi:hypothetical protein
MKNTNPLLDPIEPEKSNKNEASDPAGEPFLWFDRVGVETL